ncbi:MAG: 50S ribosomal protein L15 [Phycisphaeraceae bacterium]|nr:50S ribosomal protein L15 [Phycisphaeraceae bacterium]
MMIHEITEKVGKHRARKRVGRGQGSGIGKTCGRGHKGAGSRSGHASRMGDEGGQIPLFRRLPKRGFSNFRFRTLYAVVNLGAIEARFDDGAEVNPEMLAKVGLIRDPATPVKILAAGDLTKKLNVTASAFSQSAIAKIQDKGGTANVAGD